MARANQLIANNNQEEWEWDPTLDEWHIIKEDDPLDYVMLPYLFMPILDRLDSLPNF